MGIVQLLFASHHTHWRPVDSRITSEILEEKKPLTKKSMSMKNSFRNEGGIGHLPIN